MTTDSPLVAGVDTSTQSCKVVICDASNGRVVRQGSASHPDGTEVEPEHWWAAFCQAAEQAGGLSDVSAISVGGQQHGMVCLDSNGQVIRPALLWNDTRSAPAAEQLITEFGDGDQGLGKTRWAERVGSVPLASYTVTKLRWLVDHEPDNAARIAAIALPHDYLTWRIAGTGDIADLVTDRSDASGTGYFDSVTNQYLPDVLALALRRESVDRICLPRVLRPDEGLHLGGKLFGPGCGDNAGASLGLGLTTGGACLSLGTSGVVAAVSATPTHDASGMISGFADAAGGFLPLLCTLNGARVLDAAARLLGVDHDEFSALALSAESGAHGLVLVPYLAGERSPNLPDATGSLHHMTLASMNRGDFARAAVEGVLCLLAECRAVLEGFGVPVHRVMLVGGGAKSAAVRQLAPVVLGVPVDVPEPAEYVALGAARQAAWVATGQRPDWPVAISQTFQADYDESVLNNYRRYRTWPQ